MANNVSSTIETDNVPRTTNVSGTTKYRTMLRLDPRVYRRLKRMAKTESCTVTSLINEALTAWVMWLAKAERDETKNQLNRELAEADIRNAEEILSERRMAHSHLMHKVRREKMEKALKNIRSWRAKYPGKPWPGYVRDSEKPVSKLFKKN